MIIETLCLVAAGGLAGAHHSNKVSKESEEAYRRASLKMAKATARMQEADKHLEKEIERMIVRKKAVISYSLKKFTEIASTIKKIHFDEEKLLKKADEHICLQNELNIKMNGLDSKRLELTDKQILVPFIFGALLKLPGFGLYFTFRQDAKYEAAYEQAIRKEARIHTQYADITAESIEMLCKHIFNLTSALTVLNALFLKALGYCEKLIEKNGLDKTKYMVNDRKSLMLLFDIADALRIMVCAPILDEKNQITGEILQVIEQSNQVYDKFCKEMNALEIN